MHTSLQMPVFEPCFLILIDLIDIGLHGTCTSIERAAICLNEQTYLHRSVNMPIFKSKSLQLLRQVLKYPNYYNLHKC